MNWENDITRKLNIRYPIIQAPMLGVTSPKMVASVANAGGLGSLPLGGLSVERSKELIHETKQLTSNTFAVNLFAHEIPLISDTAKRQVEEMTQLLNRLSHENNLPTKDLNSSNFTFHSHDTQVDLIIEEQIPIVSFTFGILSDEALKKLKANNIILIGTCTCSEEAKLLEDKGVDIVCAQGIEAGGHRGSFLKSDLLPQIGSFSLIPQVCDAVSVPVIAAGGIFDKRTYNAAISLGAKGVQLGSAFINSDESLAIDSYKNEISISKDIDTKLTRSFSGKWARGIVNDFIKNIDESNLEIPTYPIQNSLTGEIRKQAKKTNNKNYVNLWAGQSSRYAQRKSCREIVEQLIFDIENN